MGKKKVKINSNTEQIEIYPSFNPKYEEKLYLAIIFLIPLIYFFKALSPSNILFGSDWMTAGYALRDFIHYSVTHYHQFPLWNPYVFGGMPVIDAFYGDLFYLTTLFRLFIPTHVVWSYSIILHVMLAGFSTYYLLKEMGLSKKSSLIGAIIYMTGGSIISQVYPGHDGKIYTSAYIPLMILMTLKGIRTERITYFLLFSLFLAFSLLGGHPQITYMFSLIYFVTVVVYLINLFSKDKRKATKQFILFAITALIFGGLIACQYLPVFSYIKYAVRGTERGYAYSTSWSLPTSELTSLIVPQFSGILNNYWGENFFKLDSQYLGIFPIFTLIPLFYYRKKWDKYVKYFFGIAILGILLALGGHTPFYRLVYLIPGVAKFRAPSMFFIFAHFSLSILAAYVLQYIIDDDNKGKFLNFLYKTLGAITAIFLIVLIAQNGLYSSLYNHFKNVYSSLMPQQQLIQKLNNFKNNYPSFISGMVFNFIILAIMIGILIGFEKWKKGFYYLFFALVFLLFLDTYKINKNYVSVEPFSQFNTKSSVTEYLIQQKGVFRVLPLFWQHSGDDYLMQYHIESAGGAGSNQLKSYQKLIGAEHTVMFNPMNLMDNNIAALINARYIISPNLPPDDELKRYPPQTRVLINRLKLFTEKDSMKPRVASFQRFSIFYNKRALNRFSIINKVIKADDNTALSLLKSPDFSLVDSAVVSSNINIRNNGKGSVTVEKYTPNRIILNVNTDSTALLLALNNYYPAWKAKIDGKKSEVIKADFSFQGIVIPAGNHKVELYFSSIYEKIGLWISLLTLIFLFATIILDVFWIKFKRR